jgi:hypothetical protein
MLNNNQNSTDAILEKINKKLYENFLNLSTNGGNKIEQKIINKEVEIYNGNTKSLNEVKDNNNGGKTNVSNLFYIDKEVILRELFSQSYNFQNSFKDNSVKENSYNKSLKEKEYEFINREEELDLKGYQETEGGLYRQDEDGWAVRDANLEEKKKKLEQKRDSKAFDKKSSNSLLPKSIDLNRSFNRYKESVSNVDLSLSLSRQYSVIRRNSFDDSFYLNKGGAPQDLGELIDTFSPNNAKDNNNNNNNNNNVITRNNNPRRRTSKSIYPQSSFKESEKHLRNYRLTLNDKDSELMSNKATFGKSVNRANKASIENVENIQIKKITKSKTSFNYDELDENDYSTPKIVNSKTKFDDKSISLNKDNVNINNKWYTNDSESKASKRNEYESEA